MSLDPILWALKDAPVADSLERLVLVALAERAARADGCTAFPSKETLSGTVLADPKTVQRVLRRLEQRGLIARGDQSAARYLRADRRPVVWDLLIPYSWFPNPDRMNAERAQVGLPPLTPAERPDIAPPPERNRRSDLGVPRPKKTPARGDSQSPRERGDSESSRDGGTDSPARGDSESRTGGLEDPRTTPVIHPEEPPLPPSPPAAEASDRVREGGRDAAHDAQEQAAAAALARIAAAAPQLVLGEREIRRLVPLVVPWLQRTTEAQLAHALTAGLPERVSSPLGLLRRRLLEKLPPPTPAASSLPPWCGECDGPEPGRRFVWTGDDEIRKCPRCHPSLAA